MKKLLHWVGSVATLPRYFNKLKFYAVRRSNFPSLKKLSAMNAKPVEPRFLSGDLNKDKCRSNAEIIPFVRSPIQSISTTEAMAESFNCGVCARILVREIDNRIRTQLQFLSSYVNLLMKKDCPDKLLGIEVQNFLFAMIELHEMLYRQPVQDLLNLSRLAREIIGCLERIHKENYPGIIVSCSFDDAEIDTERSFHFALLVAEMVSFAFQRGFPSRKGTMKVTISEEIKFYRLSVLNVTDISAAPSFCDISSNRPFRDKERELLFVSLLEHLGGHCWNKCNAGFEETVLIPKPAISQSAMRIK